MAPGQHGPSHRFSILLSVSATSPLSSFLARPGMFDGILSTGKLTWMALSGRGLWPRGAKRLITANASARRWDGRKKLNLIASIMSRTSCTNRRPGSLANRDSSISRWRWGSSTLGTALPSVFVPKTARTSRRRNGRRRQHGPRARRSNSAASIAQSKARPKSRDDANLPSVNLLPVY